MTSMKGTPLSELCLPRRHHNPLRRAGIHTVEELCTLRGKELRVLRSVGVGCVKAIEEALALRGLCLADEPLKDRVTCICQDRPALEFLMGNRRGEILECPKCSRLLYRSKVASVQTWYRQETSGVEGLTIENRHCDVCRSVEPHLLKADGSWPCLACLVRESMSM